MPDASADDLTGQAGVTDSDTRDIHGTRIREWPDAVPLTRICCAPVTACASFRCNTAPSQSRFRINLANCEGARGYDPRQVRASPDRAPWQSRDPH
jgi:hypothetical protein